MSRILLILFLALVQMDGAWASPAKCAGLFKSQQIPIHSYAFSNPEKARFTIAKVDGLRHTYIAVFNHSVYMNWALGRIATFQTQGRIITDLGLARKDSVVQSYAGHDLPAAVIREYEAALAGQDFVASESAAVLYEREFWETVVHPLLKRDPKAILLAVSLNIQPTKFHSHELLHAQYYESPLLQLAISDFWERVVTESDRNAYLKVMKREGYDVANEEQVQNEFFAYTLEKGKPTLFPPNLIRRYQGALLQYLAQMGIILLDVSPL